MPLAHRRYDVLRTSPRFAALVRHLGLDGRCSCRPREQGRVSPLIRSCEQFFNGVFFLYSLSAWRRDGG